MKNFFYRFRITFLIIALTGVIIGGLAFTDEKFEVTKNLDIFISLFKELNSNYVDDIDPAKLIKKGIDAMLETLDPYTVYIPESEAEDYQFMMSGSYGGIGAVVGKKGDYVQVSEPYEGFPAQKAGLRAGDMILKIDSKSTKGLSVADVSVLLKGQPDTKAELLIWRPGIADPFDVLIVRKNIHVKNVPYYGMIGDSIGYIYLTNFRDNASDEVKKALIELKATNRLKSVILDLRSNPGGLLFEAVKVVNVFVDRDQLVVSTKGKLESNNKDYKTTENAIDKNIPLIVLVNENSASASEIVSGSLQDLDRAVIIGQRTYGKGLVQTTHKLTYNAQLKMTTSKYYIPSGRCIQAIDYSHKDANGRAIKIADSLITAFKTKSGRIVYNGAGITPDIKIKPEKFSEIINTLLNQQIVFDFATEYRLKHDTILSPERFTLSDKDYDDFIAFVQGKNITYETSTEKALKKVQDEAKDENYFDVLKANYDSIYNKIQLQKKKELLIYKNDIKNLLVNEIVSRYYYEKGRIRVELRSDNDIQAALKLFSDPAEYNKILTGTAESGK